MTLNELIQQTLNLQLPLWYAVIFWYIGYVIGIQVEKITGDNK